MIDPITIDSEDVEEEPEFHRLFERMAEGRVSTQLVAVPSTNLLVGQIAVFLEFYDDALGGSLGDAGHFGDVTNPYVGVP